MSPMVTMMGLFAAIALLACGVVVWVLCCAETLQYARWRLSARRTYWMHWRCN
jgi:hypothetical protein